MLNSQFITRLAAVTVVMTSHRDASRRRSLATGLLHVLSGGRWDEIVDSLPPLQALLHGDEELHAVNEELYKLHLGKQPPEKRRMTTNYCSLKTKAQSVRC